MKNKSKDKARKLDLKNALRKNLRKRKIFQIKYKKLNDFKRQAN
tara:strand:+ start:172 stop:303 length:132 start_codon:yes stop_codon:yes gene_type:complete